MCKFRKQFQWEPQEYKESTPEQREAVKKLMKLYDYVGRKSSTQSDEDSKIIKS
jgi:hypothetical protein